MSAKGTAQKVYEYPPRSHASRATKGTNQWFKDRNPPMNTRVPRCKGCFENHDSDDLHKCGLCVACCWCRGEHLSTGILFDEENNYRPLSGLPPSSPCDNRYIGHDIGSAHGNVVFSELEGFEWDKHWCPDYEYWRYNKYIREAK